MSSITIRNLDEALKASPASGLAFAMRIHQRFERLGASEILAPERAPARAVPDLGSA